jgi:hypothetical protein
MRVCPRPLRNLRGEGDKPSSGSAEIRQGRRAVREYFITLGDIVTFWQVRIVAHGDQVLVLERERYVAQLSAGGDDRRSSGCLSSRLWTVTRPRTWLRMWGYLPVQSSSR